MERIGYAGLRLLAVCGLLLFASTGWGQEAAEEYDFAIALARRGFYEEAAQVAEKLAGAEKSLAQARIKKIEADGESDAAKRDAKYAEAAGILDEFIKANTDDPHVADAKFDLGSIYQSQGAAKSVELEEIADPEQREKISNEAVVVLEKAAQMFEEMLEVVNGMDYAASAELNDQREQAMYRMGVSKYYMGAAYPKGTDKRDKALQGAEKVFLDYMWDYENNVQVIYVYKFLALTYHEMGRADDAKANFEVAIETVKRILSELPQFKDTLMPFSQEVVWLLVKTLNQSGKHEEALTVVKEYFDGGAKYGSKRLALFTGDLSQFQQGIALEAAKANNALGNQDITSKYAMWVAGQNSWFSLKALEILRDLESKGVAVQFAPATLRNIAIAAAGRGDFDAAIKAFNQMFDALDAKTPDALVKEDIEIYLKSSRTLGWLLSDTMAKKQPEKWDVLTLEGAKAYKRGHEYYERIRDTAGFGKLPQSDREELGRIAYGCLDSRKYVHGLRFKQSKKEEDNRAVSECLGIASSKYSDYMTDEAYYVADEKVTGGQDLMNQGKFKEAVETLKQAVADFTRVPKTSKLYEKVPIRQGICHYLINLTYLRQIQAGQSVSENLVSQSVNDAVSAFQGYIDFAAKNPPLPQGMTQKERADLVAEANYRAGRLYVGLVLEGADPSSYEELLAKGMNYLKDFNTRFADSSYAPYAVYYETKAYLALVDLYKESDAAKAAENLQNADNTLRTFLESGKAKENDPTIASLCLQMHSKLGESEVKNKVFYVEKWLQLDSGHTFSDFDWAGKELYKLGEALELQGLKDPQLAEEAKRAFKTSVTLIQRFLETGSPTEQQKQDAQIQIALAACKVGEWELVLKSLEPLYLKSSKEFEDATARLLKNDYNTVKEREDDIKTQRELGALIGSIASPVAQAYAKTGKVKEAMDIYSGLRSKVAVGEEIWLEFTYHWAKVQVDAGDINPAVVQNLKVVKLQYASKCQKKVVDNRTLYELFEELWKKAGIE